MAFDRFILFQIVSTNSQTFSKNADDALTRLFLIPDRIPTNSDDDGHHCHFTAAPAEAGILWPLDDDY